MKIENLDAISYLSYPFGGVDKAKELGLLPKMTEFLLYPYQIRVVKPWSYLFDLKSIGYKSGEPIYIYDSKGAFLYRKRIPRYISTYRRKKKFVLPFSQKAYDRLSLMENYGFIKEETVNYYFNKIGQVLNQEEKYELKQLENEGAYLTKKEQQLFDRTEHGDYILLQFYNWELKELNFVICWVCKEISPQRRQLIINGWKQEYEAVKFRKELNYIKIELDKELLREGDQLEVYHLPESLDAFLTKEELEEDEDVEVSIFDHLEHPVFLYPDRNWWISFNLLRDDVRYPLSISSLEETNKRIIEYQNSYFFQVSIPKGVQRRVLGSVYKNTFRESIRLNS